MLRLFCVAVLLVAFAPRARAQTTSTTDCSGTVYGATCTTTAPGASPTTTDCSRSVYGASCTTMAPGAAPTATDCSKNAYGATCTSTTPGAMPTTMDCSQNGYGATCTTMTPGAMPTTTDCTRNSYGSTCTTMHPGAFSTTTNCSSNTYGVNCTTTTPPSPAELAEQQRAHQVEIQNEARGAVVIGRGVVGLFHAMHASNQRAKAERLADLNSRFVSLERDYDYGATLVTAAQARGDTAAVRRLSADQVEMSRQLTAIADSANKLSR